MQLNELKITSDDELEAWKATWDGVSELPDEVHRYMIEVVIPAHQQEMQKLINDFKNAAS